MMVRVLLVPAVAAFLIACDSNGGMQTDKPVASPTAPSSAGSASTASGPMQGRITIGVNIEDACDPDTFNAAIGPGTCSRNGGVKFDQFIAELTRLGFIGAWHFGPSNANVQVGQTFVAVNRGGETHTFTEVDDFGGGIVPQLNTLAHVPNVAPECLALDPDDFVAPGGTYTEEVDHTGNLKFQCCIHPWMRLEATSK